MKVVLLAGGFGTRISEESQFKPKPMIEIGGKPILWHIMKEYEYYGFNEFIICAGYKQYVIKEWFADYFLHNSDITFDFTKGSNDMIIHEQHCEPWKVTVVDTGLNTMTGGRIKRVQKYVGNEPFLMTYGDGVCDVDISKLVEFHKEHGKIATLTSVMLEQQKGVLDIGGDNAVKSFREKSVMDGAPINAGYMVLNPEIFDYIEGDNTVFEKDPLEKLAKEGQLMSYMHNGFWQCMDNKREMDMLEKYLSTGTAPLVKNGNYYQEGIRYKDGFKLFIKAKKVLVTGHTGFKGSWLCRILVKAGAEVTGYSLEAPTDPNRFFQWQTLRTILILL